MLIEGLEELCIESRKARRLHVRLRARIQVGFDSFRPARTLDLSRGGASLEVDRELVKGTVLALNLTPEPMRQVALRGEVVWMTPSWREGCYHVGIRFESASRADQAWLEQKLK